MLTGPIFGGMVNGQRQYLIIRGDSLVSGRRPSTDRAARQSPPVSAAATSTPILALSDVTAIAVRRTNVGGRWD